MGPRAGLDGRKISPPPGFDPRTGHPVAQSLYRLNYPAHIQAINPWKVAWWHVVPMGEKKNTYRVLVGKLEGKRAVGRPRRRWKNPTIMDLTEIVYEGVDWYLSRQYTNSDSTKYSITNILTAITLY